VQSTPQSEKKNKVKPKLVGHIIDLATENLGIKYSRWND
jgi:hypothetical protein